MCFTETVSKVSEDIKVGDKVKIIANVYSKKIGKIGIVRRIEEYSGFMVEVGYSPTFHTSLDSDNFNLHFNPDEVELYIRKDDELNYIEPKFKVGDKVMVVDSGHSFNNMKIFGKEAIIATVYGVGASRYGYKVTSIDGEYKDVPVYIDEVESPAYPDIKIGDIIRFNGGNGGNVTNIKTITKVTYVVDNGFLNSGTEHTELLNNLYEWNVRIEDPKQLKYTEEIEIDGEVYSLDAIRERIAELPIKE